MTYFKLMEGWRSFLSEEDKYKSVDDIKDVFKKRTSKTSAWAAGDEESQEEEEKSEEDTEDSPEDAEDSPEEKKPDEQDNTSGSLVIKPDPNYVARLLATPTGQSAKDDPERPKVNQEGYTKRSELDRIYGPIGPQWKDGKPNEDGIVSKIGSKGRKKDRRVFGKNIENFSSNSITRVGVPMAGDSISQNGSVSMVPINNKIKDEFVSIWTAACVESQKIFFDQKYVPAESDSDFYVARTIGRTKDSALDVQAYGAAFRVDVSAHPDGPLGLRGPLVCTQAGRRWARHWVEAGWHWAFINSLTKVSRFERADNGKNWDYYAQELQKYPELPYTEWLKLKQENNGVNPSIKTMEERQKQLNP